MGNPEQETVDATSTKTVDGSQAKIDYEKRFKDTQGAYTKSQQALKEAQAKLEALEKLTVPKVEVDEATKAELEALKYEDPDAWRVKVNQLESEAARKHQDTLNEAGRLAAQQAELERRAQVLEEFNRSHNINITDEVIQYDVPPRITKKLETGEVSFEAYLEEVVEYLAKPKVIGDGNEVLEQPDLNKIGGDDKPSTGAVSKDIAANYKNIVF
jgi:Skp family chaperone for outer membrane proteins